MVSYPEVCWIAVQHTCTQGLCPACERDLAVAVMVVLPAPAVRTEQLGQRMSDSGMAHVVM